MSGPPPSGHDPAVRVVGRFPPPLDGQSVATERLAALLEGGRWPVERVRLDAPVDEHAVAAWWEAPRRVRDYVQAHQHLKEALAAGTGPVVWTGISPSPLGHARDRLTVLPALPRAPVLAAVHHGDFDRLFRHPLTRRSARALVARLAGLVYLSRGLAARCGAVPEAKRFVVPNTVRADVIATPAELDAKRRAFRPDRPLRVLYLSNMIPEKGYPDLLDALGRLKAAGRAVDARFAGRWSDPSGPDRFARQRRALGLEGAAEALGGVADRDAVRALYLWADVFALPTFYPTEAQPLTILEALASGTPVVATRHASIPEMVRDGQEAELVAPRSPLQLAEALRRITAPDRWHRASEQARARFDAAFSPSRVQARWDETLRAVTTPGP